jgi:hypothetical protein
MRTIVNDSIHVQIKVIELRDLKRQRQLEETQYDYETVLRNLRFLHNLTQAWISFRHPTIKLWDSHSKIRIGWPERLFWNYSITQFFLIIKRNSWYIDRTDTE